MNLACTLVALAAAIVAALIGFTVIDASYWQGWTALSLAGLAAAQLPWGRFDRR